MSNPQPPDRSPRFFDGGLAVVAAIALVSGALVWWTQGRAAFLGLLTADLGFALVLLPKICGGIALAIGLGLVLPKERIRRHVGPQSGLTGLGLATLVGAVFPGGPSVIFPLVASLLTAGADIGAGVAVVSGWVLLGVNRLLVWELSFLPADLVVLRFVLTLPVPILLGIAAREIHRRRQARQ